jgi:phosphoglucomutase
MPSAVETYPSAHISALAGQPAPQEMLVDLARLEHEYFERRPDLSDPNQMVSFGTSGHRGSPLAGTFTETHILAICDYRLTHGTDGPLYMGRDTHALSTPARCTALEVLAANGVETIIQQDDGVTRKPVISRAILVCNRGRKEYFADGIVVTPSHNPPEDGGFKYNPSNGGPADADVTHWIEGRANELLRNGNAGVKRVPYKPALRASPRIKKTLSCRTYATSGVSLIWTRFAAPDSSWVSIHWEALPCRTGSQSTPSTTWTLTS